MFKLPMAGSPWRIILVYTETVHVGPAAIGT